MIYISTAGVKGESIQTRVKALAEAGVQYIELSGGTTYNPTITSDLQSLQRHYGLTFLCHNYFPPPVVDFVFNLASSDPTIYQQSLNHAKVALDFCHQFAINKIGFHAGFLFDFSLAEIGSQIQSQPLSNRAQALERFVQALEEITKYAPHIGVYIENNVLSATNAQNFNYQKPFLMLDKVDYLELNELCSCQLLLDIGHLYVTSRSLQLSFAEELEHLLPNSDYIHLSSNSGLEDTNLLVDLTNPEWAVMAPYKTQLTKKTITLEITGDPAELANNKNTLENYLYD